MRLKLFTEPQLIKIMHDNDHLNPKELRLRDRLILALAPQLVGEYPHVFADNGKADGLIKAVDSIMNARNRKRQ